MSVILLVEDNREMQSLLKVALEIEGFRVEPALDGSRACAWLSENRPSLVILDWMLPDMDGGAVASYLRTVHGDDVPILLFTADARAPEKAAQIGAFGHISKPFTLEQITENVQRAIRQD